MSTSPNTNDIESLKLLLSVALFALNPFFAKSVEIWFNTRTKTIEKKSSFTPLIKRNDSSLLTAQYLQGINIDLKVNGISVNDLGSYFICLKNTSKFRLQDVTFAIQVDSQCLLHRHPTVYFSHPELTKVELYKSNCYLLNLHFFDSNDQCKVVFLLSSGHEDSIRVRGYTRVKDDSLNIIEADLLKQRSDNIKKWIRRMAYGIAILLILSLKA